MRGQGCAPMPAPVSQADVVICGAGIAGIVWRTP